MVFSDTARRSATGARSHPAALSPTRHSEQCRTRASSSPRESPAGRRPKLPSPRGAMCLEVGHPAGFPRHFRGGCIWRSRWLRGRLPGADGAAGSCCWLCLGLSQRQGTQLFRLPPHQYPVPADREPAQERFGCGCCGLLFGHCALQASISCIVDSTAASTCASSFPLVLRLPPGLDPLPCQSRRARSHSPEVAAAGGLLNPLPRHRRPRSPRDR